MTDELFVAKYLNATDSERDQNHVSFERFLVLHIGSGSKADVVDASVQAQARALPG